MNRYISDKGRIYALYYKGKPFYIGKTKRRLYKRFNDHRNHCFSNRKVSNIKLYSFIKTITNYDRFILDIEIRCLKIVDLYEINYWEARYIEYCIDKNITIYNTIIPRIPDIRLPE